MVKYIAKLLLLLPAFLLLINCKSKENKPEFLFRTAIIVKEDHTWYKAFDYFKKILEEHYNPIITRIRSIKKPIVAAVNGVAAGAGANIALACDIVVAHEKVSFIQAFSLIGLVPDSAGTFFLPRLIGFQKALALAMLGDKISAREAEDMGMIYKCVSTEDFEETINKLATKLANMPTKALGLIKELFNASMTNTLEDQLALESKLQIVAAQSNDYAEGVAAFIEKRKPEFKGN